MRTIIHSLTPHYLGHVSGCGITEEISQWMDSIQNSAVDDNNVVPSHHNTPNMIYKMKSNHNDSKTAQNKRRQQQHHNSRQQHSIFHHDEFRYPYEKYTKEANWHSKYSKNGKLDDTWHTESHERVRRATRPKEENKNTCSLYIQTDPLIWRHIREGIADVSIYSISCYIYI